MSNMKCDVSAISNTIAAYNMTANNMTFFRFLIWAMCVKHLKGKLHPNQNLATLSQNYQHCPENKNFKEIAEKLPAGIRISAGQVFLELLNKTIFALYDQ